MRMPWRTPALVCCCFATLPAIAARADQPVASASAAASSPPASASVPVSPIASAPVSSQVLVRFEPSAPHVVLERRPDRRRGDHVDSEGSTAICLAGCTVMLDPQAVYQVGGTWVSPASFQLPRGRPGPFLVRAEPASSRVDGLGTGMVLSGGMLMGLGLIGTTAILGTGATKNSEPGSFVDHALTASITAAVAGLILTLVSLPFRNAGDTKVSIQEVPRAPSR